jgi:hypothetical protein
LPYFSALGAFSSIHVKWFAYNNLADFVDLGNLSQVLEVGLPRGSLEGWPALRCQQKRVANRNTDIPVPHVQSHNAHEIE